MPIVNLAQKFGRLTDYWTPETYGDIGNVYLKLIKAKGNYMWHSHEKEDKLYLVIKGQLILKFRESRDVVIDEGELFLVEKNTEHMPTAKDEAHVIIIAPKSASTGDKDSAIAQIFMPEVDYLS